MMNKAVVVGSSEVYSELIDSTGHSLNDVEILLKQSSAYVDTVTLVSKQKELARADEPLHFPLHALAELDKAFGDMLIDVSSNTAGFDDVEQELRHQEDDHSQEQRDNAFDVAAVHGSRWVDRLLFSFKQFKQDQVFQAKKKRADAKFDMGYERHKHNLVSKRTTLRKLLEEVERKRQMLFEKQKDDVLSAEQLREKYENDILHFKIKDLLAEVEVQKKLFETETNKHKTKEEEVKSTRVALAELLYKLQQAEDRKMIKFSKTQNVVGVDDDGVVQYDTDIDHSKREKGSLDAQEQKLQQEVTTLEALLKRNVDMTEATLEVEKRCIKQRSGVDQLLDSDEYAAFVRLTMTVSSKEQQLMNDKDRILEVKNKLRREFGIDNIDSPEGQDKVAILLNRRNAKEAAKRQAALAKVEAAVLHKSRTVPKTKIPLQRAVRTIGDESSAVLKQALDVLRSTAKNLENEIFSAEQRQVQSIFDYREHERVVAEPAPRGFMGDLSKTLGCDTVNELMQDYGLQAVAEHLAVLDNLLADCSKKQIATVRSASEYGNVEAMKEHMIDLVRNITLCFTKLKAIQKNAKVSDGELDDAKELRDNIRKMFLIKIDGRRGYMKSIDGRPAEIKFLSGRIPDIEKEIDVLKENIAKKKAALGITGNHQFKTEVMNVTAFMHKNKCDTAVNVGAMMASKNGVPVPLVDGRSCTGSEMRTASKINSQSTLSVSNITALENLLPISDMDNEENNDVKDEVETKAGKISEAEVEAGEEDSNNITGEVGVNSGTMSEAEAGGDFYPSTSTSIQNISGVVIERTAKDPSFSSNIRKSISPRISKSVPVIDAATVQATVGDSQAKFGVQLQSVMPAVVTKFCSSPAPAAAIATMRVPSKKFSTQSIVSEFSNGGDINSSKLSARSLAESSSVDLYSIPEARLTRAPFPVSQVDLPGEIMVPDVPQKMTVPFKRQPYHLQLSTAHRNLHFGGHRLQSEELISQEMLMELPEMYSRLNGKNLEHWSVIPSVPGDPFKPYYKSTKEEIRKMNRKRDRMYAKLLREQQRREHEEVVQRLARQIEEEVVKRSRAEEKEEEIHPAPITTIPEEEQELGIFDDDGTSVEANGSRAIAFSDSDSDEEETYYSSDVHSLLPSFAKHTESGFVYAWHDERKQSSATADAMVKTVDAFHLRLHPSFRV